MEKNIKTVAELGLHLDSAADIMALLGAAYGLDGVILAEADASARFWDLRTGLLGELFQKCSNYLLPLAIALPQPERYGPRLAELAYEHRQHPLIRWVDGEAQARTFLLLAEH